MSIKTAAASYLAVHHLGSSRAVLAELPFPAEPLADHEIEGSTLVSLVSPGTESVSFRHHHDLPRASGYAAVFHVDRVGSAVAGWRRGQVAFAQGPHASFQRVNAAEALPVPDGVAPEVAVFARLMGVGWATLVTTTARPADRVLVIGLGIVGHLVARDFHAAGYRVTAVDPVAIRRELLKSAGIAEVLAEVPAGDEGAGGFALVVDCSGHEGAVLAGLRAVRWGGEVVLLGTPWKQHSDETAHAVTNAVFHRYARLRSGWEWQLPMRPQPHGRGSTVESFESALHWLAEGRVDVANLAVLESPSDVERVMTEVGAGTAEHLTAVFDWR